MYGKLRVSHETIYRFAYANDGRDEQFFRHLPEHRRRRRPHGRRRHNRSQILDVHSLSDKPCASPSVPSSTTRMSLMMFRKALGKVNVASLLERMSCYSVVMRNEDRQSKPITEALIKSLVPPCADACQSITFDCGTEFSAWLAFEGRDRHVSLIL